ncbi:MAG: DUF3179 domain-containing protein [Cyclobacteriaceae bacterium]
MKGLNLFLLIILILSTSCEEDSTTPRALVGSVGSGGWSIPDDEIYDGGPGKDGIPALENPTMISADEATLGEDDLVVGVVFDGQARAYSHQVLDWHEIINDQIGMHPFAVTYCPLTGTAINWSRNIGGEITTFGVSGLLYNSNLIPYDRKTDSNWSQMLNRSVEGSLIGQSATTILPAIETSWGTWKKMYPKTQIVSTNTGHERPYGSYPYIASGNFDYRVEPFLIFPVAREDERLHKKERVLGVQDIGRVHIYRFKDFQGDINLRKDDLIARQIVIAGSTDLNFMVAYQASLKEGTRLDFSALSGEDLPNLMTDQLGNTWDIFGQAVSGPNVGEKLYQPKSYIGYWFAWVAFNAEVEIIEF